jgi:predicted O-methyltransferase YrrM
MIKNTRWPLTPADRLYVKTQQMAVEEQAVVLAALGAAAAARAGCRFLEVGSWCGDSAVVLGKIAKEQGGRLYCVDWWKGNVGTGLESVARKVDVYSLFWQRILQEGLEDIVIPIRGRSADVAGILADGAFDLIYIDGDHRFNSVQSDIANFAPRVRNDGILCGDDCEGRITDFDAAFLDAGKDLDFLESVHCGVVLAVGEAFPHCSIDYNIWSVRRAGAGWKATDVALHDLPRKQQFPPPLIETYAGHNLVRYGRLVYAIPHALGPVDITEESVRDKLHALSSPSVASLRKKIDDNIGHDYGSKSLLRRIFNAIKRI